MKPAAAPTHTSLDEHQLAELLQAAARAPSAHNTQPWKAEALSPHRILISRDPSRTLAVGDPTTRQATIAIGMFIEGLVIAATHLGLDAQVAVIAGRPADEAIAMIDLVESEITPDPLYYAFTQRHTNRGPYRDADIPEEIGDAARDHSDELGLTVIDDALRKAAIGELVTEGMSLALRLPAMRAELAELCSWHREAADTGLVAESMVAGVLPDGSASTWLRELADPHALSLALGDAYRRSPRLFVISSPADDPEAWIAVGRAAYRLLLTAATAGLTHCISAAPIEVPTLMPRLRALLDTPARPQLLMRVGPPEHDDLTLPSGRRRVTAFGGSGVSS